MIDSWKKITILSAILLLLMGCTKEEMEEYKEVLKVSGKGETLAYKYYTIDGSTNIYTTFDSIKYDNEELEELLVSKKITLEELVKKMELRDTLNDGGSKYYKDGNVYVAICNSLEGNHNIYIGNNKDVIQSCSFNAKTITDCLNTTLNSLVTSKKVSSKSGKITDITKNKNYESVTYKKSKLGEYVLIKTEDEEIVNDLKTYFNKKNKKYYYSNFVKYAKETYHIFFYDTKSTDITEKVNACINK